jgi:hypothetical protein
MDLRRLVGGVLTELTWLWIGTIGGLLWMQWWILGFWHHGVSYKNCIFCKDLLPQIT